MIRRASSACISGLTSRGSGVIHTDTSDLEGSSPEAVARSTSHLVKIPARNDACTTTAEPALALTMAAAALAMLVSGVTVTALAERRSRTVTHGSAAAPARAVSHVLRPRRGLGPLRRARPCQLLREYPSAPARQMRRRPALLPEHLTGGHAGLGTGPLRDHGAGDLLRAADRVGEPAVDVVHATTFRASVSRCFADRPSRAGASPSPGSGSGLSASITTQTGPVSSGSPAQVPWVMTSCRTRKSLVAGSVSQRHVKIGYGPHFGMVSTLAWIFTGVTASSP